MHPAIVIFLSVVLVQAIAAFGKDRLQEILWFFYTAVFHRRTLSSQRALRKEIYTTKQELAATSSQDQFAKWAKLRRRVDKGLADLEKKNAELTSSRSTFGMLFKGLMFIITTIMPFCITSWYGKTPIFWLPPGENSWFGPVGWFLALPRAPKGAVSSTVWQMVCTRTLISVAGALANLVPGKKEEVLKEGSIEEIAEEKKKQTQQQQQHQHQQGGEKKTTSSATSPKTAAEDGARKRTNVAAGASEKQDL